MGARGIHRALAGDINAFGIKVTIIEPGGYRTGQAARIRPAVTPLAAYQPIRDDLMERQPGRIST
jgi:NAD(P)-dependent dehydrogenase (short-subunit alcohol dehydrogenase family)